MYLNASTPLRPRSEHPSRGESCKKFKSGLYRLLTYLSKRINIKNRKEKSSLPLASEGGSELFFLVLIFHLPAESALALRRAFFIFSNILLLFFYVVVSHMSIL